MKDSLFSALEADALREIGNISSGNASTKLSNLVNRKVLMELTNIDIISPESLDELYPITDENMVVASFIRVNGEISGNIVTIFNREVAIGMIGMIDGTILKSKEIKGQQEEEFKIIGSKFANAYMDALRSFLKVDLQGSDPIVQVNQKGIIFKFIIHDLNTSTPESILMLKTRFNVEGSEVSGEFVLLFGLSSLEEFKKLINKAIES